MPELNEQNLTPSPMFSGRKVSLFVIALFLIIAAGALFYITKYPNITFKSDLDPREIPYRSQPIEWKKCGDEYLIARESQSDEFDAGTAECGTFDVPANYLTELGNDLPDLSIAVLKSPALDQKNKLGTLFYGLSTAKNCFILRPKSNALDMVQSNHQPLKDAIG